MLHTTTITRPGTFSDAFPGIIDWALGNTPSYHSVHTALEEHTTLTHLQHKGQTYPVTETRLFTRATFYFTELEDAVLFRLRWV
jgi:hypothetical protein